MRLFLTGDRSMPTELALGPVLLELARAFAAADGEQVLVLTGDQDGVERAVRLVCKEIGVEPQVIPTGVDVTTGVKDFVERARQTALVGVDKVLVLHTDAMASRITRALLDNETLAPITTVTDPRLQFAAV
jgi:hypothetical protein